MSYVFNFFIVILSPSLKVMYKDLEVEFRHVLDKMTVKFIISYSNLVKVLNLFLFVVDPNNCATIS